jgi:hypothetical protein
MKLQPKDHRVDRFLRRHLRSATYDFAAVEDPRARRGRRWKLPTLLRTLLDGMLANCESLRDVEELTAQRAERGRTARRVPDTTLYQLAERLPVDGFLASLHQQVYGLYRGKSLEPAGLPCGVLSLDGKLICALDHDGDGAAQKSHSAHDGAPFWMPRVLRAVLTSSPTRPCVHQMTVPADTNEMGAFAAFFEQLVAAYGGNDFFEIVTGDAGLVSREHARLVTAADKAYVFALKDSQPELRREAERLLLPLTTTAPAAQTPWETAKGKQFRRSLWRTTDIAGYHDWTHLQQAWLVRTECRDKDGSNVAVVEDRYFLTSVRTGRLTPAQILQVVRGHWGIENDCFGTLDMRWGEDQRRWATRGHAVEVLGVLRLMAYNLLQLLRVRHLRVRRADGGWGEMLGWRSLFRWVRDALRLPASTATHLAT